MRLYFITVVLLFTFIPNNVYISAEDNSSAVEALSLDDSNNSNAKSVEQNTFSVEVKKTAEELTTDEEPSKSLKERLEEVRRKRQEEGLSDELKLPTPEENIEGTYKDLDEEISDSQTNLFKITNSNKVEEQRKIQYDLLITREPYYKDIYKNYYNNTYIDPKVSEEKSHQFKLFSLDTLIKIIGIVILYNLAATFLKYRDKRREEKERQKNTSRN